MTMKTVAAVASAVAIGSGAAPAISPAQIYPGQPTQARVFVENRGHQEAIPVSVQQVTGDPPLRVGVSGTPSVAIVASSILDIRQVRQTWEYQRVQVPAGDDPTPELNRLGREGWEAVAQYITPRGALAVVLKRSAAR